MTFRKRQNHGDDKMISDCWVWDKVERDEQAETKDFQSSEILCILRWWIRVITHCPNPENVHHQTSRRKNMDFKYVQL